MLHWWATGGSLFFCTLLLYVDPVRALPDSYKNVTFLTLEFSRAKGSIVKALNDKEVGAPILVRLSWLDAGTYCQYCFRRGGPHALLRFKDQSADPQDAGSETARGPLHEIMINDGFNATITIADFWAFAADVALEYSSGPKIVFRPGREDWGEEKVTPFDRLPMPAFGYPDFSKMVAYLRAIFYRMDFTDQEIVALIGAHTLGGAHKAWSGFYGSWTSNPETFDNSFYQGLLNANWTNTAGTEQYNDGKEDGLFRLHSDMALLYDQKFLHWVKTFASNQTAFFTEFGTAFRKLQEAGVETLLPPIVW